jgi:hypothetical protein
MGGTTRRRPRGLSQAGFELASIECRDRGAVDVVVYQRQAINRGAQSVNAHE